MSIIRKSTLPDESEQSLYLQSAGPSSNRLNPAAFPTATAAAGYDIDLLDSVRRHWRLALVLAAVIALFGSIWVIRNMRPVYQAETTIYISPELAKDANPAAPDASYRTLVNQQIMTLLHSDNLRDTIRLLGQKNIGWRLPGESERQAIERLRSSLAVAPVPDSYELSVRMTSGNPVLAATIANTVAQSYLNEESRPDATGSVDRGTVLTSQKAVLEQELQKQLDLRGKLAESLEVINPQKGTTLPDDQVLFQTREALATAHGKRIEAEAHLATGQSAAGPDGSQIDSSDPAIRASVASLLQRQNDLRERIKNMLPSHPVRKQAEVELAEIDAELNGARVSGSGAASQPDAKLRAQAETARRIEADLNHDIADQTSTIPSRARNLEQVELVNAEITRIQQHLNEIGGQIEDVTLRSTSGAMRIFALAQPPISPMKSQKTKALAIVFAMALLLGIGLPVGLDLLDSRIYDPSTVERILGFPIVGMTIKRTPKVEDFASEQANRLVAGIVRGIAGGAQTILIAGLRQPASSALTQEIARLLPEYQIDVTVRSGMRRLEPKLRLANGQTKIIGPGAPGGVDLTGCSVVLVEGPPLLFSADAERLAAEADMTLVAVRAGIDTRSDLVRCARLLERGTIPAIGVIFDEVQVDRAGRRLREDLKEYATVQHENTPAHA